MNPDLVEAVARAMWADTNDLSPDRFEKGTDPITQQTYRSNAKAAIKAHEQWLAEQGLVVVPDNDWSFWSKVVQLPEIRKKMIYQIIETEAAE